MLFVPPLKQSCLVLVFHLVLAVQAGAQTEPQGPAPPEGRLFAFLDDHVAMMLLIDPDSGLIVDANRSALRFYVYPRLVGMNIQEINLLSPEEILAERRRALLEERNYFLFPHRLADGSVSTVEVYSSPVIQPSTGRTLLLSVIHPTDEKQLAVEDVQEYTELMNLLVARKNRELGNSRLLLTGAVMLLTSLGALGLFLGITLRERRHSELVAREALTLRLRLYRELQHRVKNSLALISSMISIEAQRLPDSEESLRLEALTDRVTTLAALYDQMFIEESDGSLECAAYLRAIVEGLHRSCGSACESVDFVLELAELELSSGQASALGLIANELITNALKHGPRDNRIHVSLQHGEGKARMAVRSRGELPTGFSLEEQNGFGLVLSAELARQLGGSLIWSSSPDTVEFAVDFTVAFDASGTQS